MKHKINMLHTEQQAVEDWLNQVVQPSQLIVGIDGDEMIATFITGVELDDEDQTLILESLSASSGKFNLADWYSHYFFFDDQTKANQAKGWVDRNMPRAHNTQVMKLEDHEYKYCLYLYTAGPVDTSKLWMFASEHCDCSAKQTNVATYNKDEQ